MSRAVVFRALCNDPELNGMGIDINAVFPNWSMEERPKGDGPFLILRWADSFYAKGINRGPRILTIWAHMPQERTSDFGEIDVILDRVEDLLVGLEQIEGEDGYTLTSIRATGTGGDLTDQGYATIVRNAAFEILSRRTFTG